MYTKERILEINNMIEDAIKAVIRVRRLDEDGNIYSNPTDIYNKASSLVQDAIDVFEEFYDDAYELYSYSIFINEMTMNYNFMLDLCELDASVNEYTRDRWLNKTPKTINDIDI